jgi:hypothetical protein
MNSSQRSFHLIENSIDDLNEKHQIWKDLDNEEAETLQIAGAFIDKSKYRTRSAASSNVNRTKDKNRNS